MRIANEQWEHLSEIIEELKTHKYWSRRRNWYDACVDDTGLNKGGGIK